MHELLDKQVNAQKESLKNTSGVHASSCKPTKKVCNDNGRNKQTRKNNGHVKMLSIEGIKPFITPIPKTGENDLHELQINDYGYNEGTIHLVNKWIGAKGMVF